MLHPSILLTTVFSTLSAKRLWRSSRSSPNNKGKSASTTSIKKQRLWFLSLCIWISIISNLVRMPSPNFYEYGDGHRRNGSWFALQYAFAYAKSHAAILAPVLADLYSTAEVLYWLFPLCRAMLTFRTFLTVRPAICGFDTGFLVCIPLAFRGESMCFRVAQFIILSLNLSGGRFCLLSGASRLVKPLCKNLCPPPVRLPCS